MKKELALLNFPEFNNSQEFVNYYKVKRDFLLNRILFNAEIDKIFSTRRNWTIPHIDTIQFQEKYNLFSTDKRNLYFHLTISFINFLDLIRNLITYNVNLDYAYSEYTDIIEDINKNIHKLYAIGVGYEEWRMDKVCYEVWQYRYNPYPIPKKLSKKIKEKVEKIKRFNDIAEEITSIKIFEIIHKKAVTVTRSGRTYCVNEKFWEFIKKKPMDEKDLPSIGVFLKNLLF